MSLFDPYLRYFTIFGVMCVCPQIDPLVNVAGDRDLMTTIYGLIAGRQR